MAKFRKQFVRVEWLAVQKAVDLMREAGFDNSYFVSQAHLIGDEGQAPIMAEIGRELFDDKGKLIGFDVLHAEDFGLENEIEEFVPLREKLAVEDGSRYFLKRTYAFQVFQKGEVRGYVSIWVSFAKRAEQDDWEIVHECVTDQRKRTSKDSKDRWVIYRPDQLRHTANCAGC